MADSWPDPMVMLPYYGIACPYPSCACLGVKHSPDDILTQLPSLHTLHRQAVRLFPLVETPHLHNVCVRKAR